MTRSGGCNCGKVRITVVGDPTRIGLCHCLTCRKETGSVLMAFADWPKHQVTVVGEVAGWTSTTDRRHFCPACGSTLFATDVTGTDDDVEIRLGTLDDAPSGLLPQYELWTVRREGWLGPVGTAAQHRGNRP